MKISELENIIQRGESGTLEFKTNVSGIKGAAKTLCAFLNGKGGTVLIGVSDNKKIIGQDVTDHTRQEIANALRKFEPTANIEVQYIDYEPNKQIIALIAHPDPRSLPYSFDGRAYERKESSTNIMPQGKYQQLLLAKNLNPLSWESQPALGVSIEDLDRNEIIATVKNIAQKKRLESNIDTNNIEEILKRLKLINAGQITNAAVVLFAKEIPGNYLQCVIRMARFKGTEKRNFIDSKHVFGNAFQLLQEAENFITRNSAIASRFEKGQFARIDEPEYPFDAVREALINSICHREYASVGGSITLMIFDDRLEIANSGILLSDITLGDLKKAHVSHSRNPRITNVFFRRGLIEEMGIGTQEIIKTCIAAKMKEPDFYEQAGAFVVRLWSPQYQAPTSTEIDLTERQKNILKLLEINPLAPHEMLRELKEDISDRTLRRDLQDLKEKAYIDSEGLGRKARWFLLPKPAK